MAEIVCPNHEGGFDCPPFCGICEGNQYYEEDDLSKCSECQAVFNLEDGGFLWEGLAFCELHDPKGGEA
jgi:hypothetical protein